MQKKLIVLALAGMVAAPAFAQSNVTIYGRVDLGYMSRGGESGLIDNVKTKNELASGVQSGSRIGFKGAEDLGNGLKAIFEVEYGIGIDQPNQGLSGASQFSNRHSYVGLTGGFGTVVGGRLDGVRYGVFNAYDPFAGGTVGNFTQMTTQYDRADNAIAYISPKWSGFGLVLAHSTNTGGQEGQQSQNTDVGAPGTGTRVGNKSDDVLYTIMGTYDNGPLSVKLDYETTTQKSIGDSRLYVATVGASYDFGMVKISGVYDVINGDDFSNIGSKPGEYDRRNWFIGARAPIGKFTLKANYGRVKNKEANDADASKWAIGVDYALSKRTNLYADFAKIKNDDGAGFAINPGANSSGNFGNYGVRGFDIGLAHNF